MADYLSNFLNAILTSNIEVDIKIFRARKLVRILREIKVGEFICDKAETFSFEQIKKMDFKDKNLIPSILNKFKDN
jgi:hypothetical protein